jgi:hypothetical protein
MAPRQYWWDPLEVMCRTPWSRGINKLRTSGSAYRTTKSTSHGLLEARSNLTTSITQQYVLKLPIAILPVIIIFWLHFVMSSWCIAFLLFFQHCL